MKNKFFLLFLAYVCLSVLFCVLVWKVSYKWAQSDKQADNEKELCIVLKHERNAQKFLDNDCTRYVTWNY